MSTPVVSVVIATYQRPEMLRSTLEALAAPQGLPGPFEVIVVDDASGDATTEVLRSLEASYPWLRHVSQERNGGPAKARNRGWREARAEFVAFTDDDCVPQPGWLAALMRAAAGADLVQGRTVPDPAARDAWGPFSRAVETVGISGYYETCNMLYRRDTLERAGGFDETFRMAYGEDCDLALRVLDAGGTEALAEDALVHHAVLASSYRRRLRDARRRGNLVRVVKKHPHARARFGGWWLRPEHPMALAALAGAVVGLWLLAIGHPWLGLLCALATVSPWLYRRTITIPLTPDRSSWPVTLPLELLADLYEVSVMARASVRERTLLL